MLWSLCLTSRQEGRRAIVQLPPAATTGDLYRMAEAQFGGTSSSNTITSLKYGFPPKSIDNDDTQPIQAILQNQERIQVELGASTSITTGITVPAPALSSSRKSKRAAAQRATEIMPAMIQAQEELLQQEPKNEPPRKRRAAAATRPKFPTASVGQGRRLADGSTVAVAAASRKKRSNILGHENNQKKSSSDMSEALLVALNDSGEMGQILRKGMKNAVQASYETTRVFSRLAAIQAKKYQMENVRNERGDARPSLLIISYQGSVDKIKTEEQVECIPRDVLEAVIKGIHASNDEALRPVNLALLSPRVLWSLVHIFPSYSTIPEMYRELLPDLDWTFLRRRAQQLSEKALENLRQEQEINGETNRELAVEAISAVEHAMEHLQDYTAAERQARQAQAALDRLQAGSNCQNGAADCTSSTMEWTLSTPSEPDREELRQCIQGTTHDVTKIITKLMREFQIHNWRELANVEDARTLAQKLGLRLEEVQPWIDRAQDQSVEEIIVEICDNNVGAVELLTEKARSGTPKDLAVWRAIPRILHQRLGAVEEGAPSLEQLRTWSHRAHQVLQEYEWLNWYATPVE